MTDDAIKAALSEFDACWLTVWAEARAEPVEGQIAVACVIRNRVQRPKRFGSTYKAVCLRPVQFSCWNPGTDRNHMRLMQLAQNTVADYAIRSSSALDPVIRQIQYIVQGVMGGQLSEDRSRGADHYLTTQLLETKPPRWARDVTPVAFIANHAFLKVG